LLSAPSLGMSLSAVSKPAMRQGFSGARPRMGSYGFVRALQKGVEGTRRAGAP
jgi:hypothetical protein